MEKTITRHNKNTLNFAIHPILNRIYANRNIQSQKELERGLDHLLPFHDLLGIQSAVSCLASALENQQKILIVGDFDSDGATSTALAIRALKSLGAKDVRYLVPNRFEFGYGLSPELVEVAKEFSPDLIVTVDNGIANHAGVSAAKEAGIKVLITDHHLPSETLPSADAIVNPNQLNDPFASKCIAGVGVIFYVMLALRRYLCDQDWFAKKNIPEPNMSQFLDLVALGTVADVVSLDHNNRIMVYQGLRRIRSNQCIPGITALLQIASRNQSQVTSTDLGFAVAPRLNAAGRLDDMSLGIECLLSDDLNQAREMAIVLDQLNDERRAIEQEMQTQALAVLNSISFKKTDLPRGICLYDENWHQGVIGILAGRVKDRFHRPVIVFAPANDIELKGSARSIYGLHIRDALSELTIKYPSLIKKFGGHSMAAGLTINRADFKKFSEAFNDIVCNKLDEESLNQVLLSDGELSKEELDLEMAEILREAGPWGQLFPEPLFDGVFTLLDQRLVGGKHLKMNLSKDDKVIDAIAFNVDLNRWPNYRCRAVNIAYRLDVNEFRGSKKLQLVVEYLRGIE